VVAIVQARMGSTRLPGKTLADVSGQPLLARVLSQLSGARELDEIVVATTVEASDAPVAELTTALGYRAVRGDTDDVLGRFLLASELSGAEVVVRLTGDCPLHSPDTIDDVVRGFLSQQADYASNTDPYSRPDGQDVEVFTFAALARAAAAALPGPDREHVTPWIRRESSLRRINVTHGEVGGTVPRWTVDEPDDLRFVRDVWQRLDALGRGPFSYEVIMKAVTDSVVPEGAAMVNEGYYRSVFQAAPAERAAALPITKSEEWLARSEKVIPGGAQTYSKSWRQHIRGVSPVFLERGAGARVWDVDGNEYVDLIQGLLPNILGYAHPEVNAAYYEQAQRGHSFSLAHPLEVELAERLTRLIPCAEKVRFGKNGSDATAGAVRVARAFTGRDRVAVCGYHGWQDWFIGTTSCSAGVPDAVASLAHPFPYNDPAALDRLLSQFKGEFAAVIMEPVNFFWPADGYLQQVKETAHRHGTLLIFDEICTGFHLGLGGAQKMFGVTPDLAAFGKAMGNGYPISCIVGRRDVMEVFNQAFVSFTFAGDVAAMAAASRVLDFLEDGSAYERIAAAGRRLMDGARTMIALAGLEGRVTLTGHPHWPLIRFAGADGAGADDPVAKALWMQEMTRRGVLILATHNICAALDESAVDVVLKAYASAFKVVRKAIDAGQVRESLDGPIPTPAFRARG
jgi:glutamate-1-semialdehyde 2,1-aminomutase/spore coat polysaccharide biosynthesis protein SpsF